jgi:outer membrane protein assembly factor BamB
MSRSLFAFAVALASVATADAQWSQFGGNARHTSSAALPAQPLVRVLADVTDDPFVPDEIQNGDLLVHYPVPLLDGDDVFMSVKEQVFIGPSFPIPGWSVHRLHWENGQLVEKWSTRTDWKPVPAYDGLWEPVFQSILANGFIFAPAAGGTLLQIDRTTGAVIRRIDPFSSTNSLTFVSGPPTVDSAGNIFYGAFGLQSNNPWQSDVTGAWLVRIKPDLSTALVPFSTLVPDAPKGSDLCTFQFSPGSARMPPSPEAVAPSIVCGSQRPGLNSAPAVAADGTIYLISRAHFNNYWSYVIAVNPDLTRKWDKSLRNRFHDGCNVLLPPNGTNGGCPEGTTTGVDPHDNQPGSGRVTDNSTASPIVAPDGSVIYGSYTVYNGDQGHLVHFAADGTYLDHAYPFGWDTTPAIWQHGGTYSVVTKENHYDFGIGSNPAYFITQLDSSFKVEWQYRNPSRTICRDGACVSEDAGFEWCLNAPAVDANGTIYGNAEDGMLYAIAQGGVQINRIPLDGPIGAAYTPVAIDAQGRVYAQSGGHMFAVGGLFPRRRAAR